MEELISGKFDLSPITFGTMRFKDKGLTTTEVVRLLETGFDAGISTHHSSYEYSSYELYCKALQQLSCKKEIKHIVKLSAPHFEESHFSSKVLIEKVDSELKHLGVETIDVLQWLVRSKPINDEDRIRILEAHNEEIKSCLEHLNKSGKVKHVFSFPYSPTFAERVVETNSVDGIIGYLNKEETDYAPFANTLPFIAIRPFFAGKLIDKAKPEKSILDNLSYVKGHKGVISQIVGINSLEQLKTIDVFLD